MPSSAPRVLVARLWHESHAFNPLVTGRGSFSILRGDASVEGASGTTLGGIVAALRQGGAEVLPTFLAQASPGGPVDHGLFLELKAELLYAVVAQRPDGIALDLHGALATTELADADGDLLAALRAAAPRVPIAVGLDLHAGLSRRMLRSADALIACKENPHSDVVEAGERVGRLALKMIGGWRPVTTAMFVPMLLTGGADTSEGPLKEAHDLARTWEERAGIADISIYNSFPFQDIEEIGQAVTALGDAGAEAAGEAVAGIAALLWERRREFRTKALSTDEALDRVLAHPEARPFVLADMGDRTLAGAPGDSTHVIERCLARRDGLRGIVPVTDALAVRAAQRAGTGATVELELGGGVTPWFQPLAVRAEVLALNEGRFTLRGPFMAGQQSDMGDCALLGIGDLLVLATSAPAFSTDPNVFVSQGIDLAALDFMVVKSGFHFRLSFEGVATPLIVNTPGMATYRPGTLPYRNVGAIYPEEDRDWSAPAPESYP